MTVSASTSSPPSADLRRIAVARGLAALVWAAALVLAAGDTHADLPAALALLVAAYPLIDVAASLAEAQHGGDAAPRRRANAVLSGAAAVGLGVAAFGADVGSVLAVFGVWAVVSGLVQLAGAIERRRRGSREVPMLIAGGLSAIVGVSMVATAGADEPSLLGLAGYAAFGALLFGVWALRSQVAARPVAS